MERKTHLAAWIGILTFLVSCSEHETILPKGIASSEPQWENPVPLLPQNCYIGSLMGFEGDLIRGNAYKKDTRTTYFNQPLYESALDGAEGRENDTNWWKTEEGKRKTQEWWGNMAEEIAYSGIDYIALNFRGYGSQLKNNPVKTDHGDPDRVSELVQAMKERGVENKFKIAIFDDCPASWEAARNHYLGRGYSGWDGNKENNEKRLPFPLKTMKAQIEKMERKGWKNCPEEDKIFRDSVYQFIWDFNIKAALRNIIDEGKKIGVNDLLFTYEGKPLIFFWGCGFVRAGDNKEDCCNGLLSYICKRLYEDCYKETGMYPLLVVDQDWSKRDYSIRTCPYIGGISGWFTMAEPRRTFTHNGLTVGTTVPSFVGGDKDKGPMENWDWIDPRHGNHLKESLDDFINKGCNLIFLEGFTDVMENAALWRAKKDAYEKTHYDYCNQRLNILRQYSHNPYPKTYRLEAEACDEYDDTGSTRSGKAFRLDGLDIYRCNDKNAGWHVRMQAGNYLQWKEIPVRAGYTVFKIRYKSTNNATINFQIDGNNSNQPNKILPSTGGLWETIECCPFVQQKAALHTITLQVSRKIDINYFDIVTQ